MTLIKDIRGKQSTRGLGVFSHLLTVDIFCCFSVERILTAVRETYNTV